MGLNGLNPAFFEIVNRRRDGKIMRWIDGKQIDIKQFTGETLCEKLAAELWDVDCGKWQKCADFIQAAAFLIAFDTELTMEGIWGFLENSIGHYASDIIKAFRAIGDCSDADTLEEICRLASPDVKMTEEVEAKIQKLNRKLYLNSGFDIWSLLFSYLDEKMEKMKDKG